MMRLTTTRLLVTAALSSGCARAQESPRLNGTNFTLIYYYYSPRPYAFRESENLWVPAFPLLTLNDTDSFMLSSAALSFDATTYDGDELQYVSSSKEILAAWNAKTGTLAMIGSQTVPYWEAALRSVQYRASNTLSLTQRPNRHDRYLTLEVVDSSGRSARTTQHIFLETARTVITERTGGVTLSR